ncbi:MAG: 2-polyprenyl-3-methyl-5-hydroxy-6-metoxy-1,4-benzoquinol methylase [Gammaproteobacteria bacterium]|nr:MAG: 2-polyprenyl-3-methyl-5-hydroxy-6-metoxy-1,4-benzoquinol methylase [Gammaproteobacteria bacterium]
MSNRHQHTDYLCPLCLSQKTRFFFADGKNYQHIYYRCLRCDLVFVAPPCRLDSVEEKARYDMHDNDENDTRYVQFLARLANPMLQRLLHPSQGLDFGSGTSQAMANFFYQAGHSCHRYDIYYAPEHELLKQRYDFIVASEVIEHLYEPKGVIEQWLTMLRPDGLLGIMTGLRSETTDFPNWWYKNDPTHVALFSRQTLAYLAKQYHLTFVYQHKNVTIFRLPETDSSNSSVPLP